MPLWPTINEALIVVSALNVALGWAAIRRERRTTHRAFMLTGALFGAAFFASYLTREILHGDTAYAGPPSLQLTYFVVLAIHIALATSGAVLGIITLRWALLERFSLHRRIGPWTARVWLMAALSGLAVFLLLYRLY